MNSNNKSTKKWWQDNSPLVRIISAVAQIAAGIALVWVSYKLNEARERLQEMHLMLEQSQAEATQCLQHSEITKKNLEQCQDTLDDNEVIYEASFEFFISVNRSIQCSQQSGATKESLERCYNFLNDSEVTHEACLNFSFLPIDQFTFPNEF